VEPLFQSTQAMVLLLHILSEQVVVQTHV
jgi:hypothetical protein